MKTPFDSAVAKLVDLAREGFSRGWDCLDRADKHDAIADAIGWIHAEWFQLVEARDAAIAERDKLRALLVEACDIGEAAIGQIDTDRDDGLASNAFAASTRLATIRTEALK